MSEALRELRTNLAYVKVDAQPRVIVMTSPQPGDGKSTLAANLAESLAVSSDQRVVVIDCDLRRPTLSKVLGVSEGAGLTDVLSGRAQLHQVMQQTEAASNLWVVGAGRIPPNPSELLGSKTFQDLVSTLAEHATVILDAPPVLAVTDAAVLAAKADGVLMTASAARTTFDQLDRALQLVTRGGGDVLGVVLNRVPTKGRDAREYGYFGGSYYYYEGDVGTGGEVGPGAGSGPVAPSPEAVTAPAPVVAATPAATPEQAQAPAPAAAPGPARVPASPGAPASPAEAAEVPEAPGGALTRREIRERERTR
nr:CpsD/CapB family tyrosine-protein kinase [Frigoribacterium endophyticum]